MPDGRQSFFALAGWLLKLNRWRFRRLRRLRHHGICRLQSGHLVDTWRFWKSRHPACHQSMQVMLLVHAGSTCAAACCSSFASCSALLALLLRSAMRQATWPSGLTSSTPLAPTPLSCCHCPSTSTASLHQPAPGCAPPPPPPPGAALPLPVALAPAGSSCSTFSCTPRASPACCSCLAAACHWPLPPAVPGPSSSSRLLAPHWLTTSSTEQLPAALPSSCTSK